MLKSRNLLRVKLFNVKIKIYYQSWVNPCIHKQQLLYARDPCRTIQRGRGHCAVYNASPQSLRFLIRWLNNLGDFN